MHEPKGPKDPLLKAAADPGRELLKRFASASTGFSRTDVENAAAALLLNSIRQRCASWREAEVIFDELFGRSKQLLKNHYDASGRVKGIFPFDQVIRPELFDDSENARFNGRRN